MWLRMKDVKNKDVEMRKKKKRTKKKYNKIKLRKECRFVRTWGGKDVEMKEQGNETIENKE